MLQDAGVELDVVRLGAHNLGESEFEDVDDYVPQQVFVHPQYKQGNFPENDIAIVVLQTEGKLVYIKTFLANFQNSASKHVNL